MVRISTRTRRRGEQTSRVHSWHSWCQCWCQCWCHCFPFQVELHESGPATAGGLCQRCTGPAGPAGPGVATSWQNFCIKIGAVGESLVQCSMLQEMPKAPLLTAKEDRFAVVPGLVCLRRCTHKVCTMMYYQLSEDTKSLSQTMCCLTNCSHFSCGRTAMVALRCKSQGQRVVRCCTCWMPIGCCDRFAPDRRWLKLVQWGRLMRNSGKVRVPLVFLMTFRHELLKYDESASLP